MSMMSVVQTKTDAVTKSIKSTAVAACVHSESETFGISCATRHSEPTFTSMNSDSCITSSLTSSGFWDDFDSLGSSKYDMSSSRNAEKHNTYNTDKKYSSIIQRNINKTEEQRTNNAIKCSSHDSLVHQNQQQRQDQINRLVVLNVKSKILWNENDSIINEKGYICQNITNSWNKKGAHPTCLYEGNTLQSIGTEEDHLWQTHLDWYVSEEDGKNFVKQPNLSRLCSSDSDDEEKSDDDVEITSTTRKPQTRFEAALQRAHIAELHRNALAQTKSYRIMPDWGSPIQLHRPKSKETIQENNGTYLRTMGSVEDASSLSASSPMTSGQQICTGIDAWLYDRPHRLYENPEYHLQSLQLCYLSNLEEEYLNSYTQETMDDTEVLPDADEDSNRNITDDKSTQSEERKSLHTQNVSESTIVVKPSSLTAENVSNSELNEFTQELIEKISEIDRYFEFYVQDAIDNGECPKFQRQLIDVMEKHRNLQTKTQIALIQVPNLVKMQLLVEKQVLPNLTKHSTPIVTLPPFLRLSDMETKSITELALFRDRLLTKIKDVNEQLIHQLEKREKLQLEKGSQLTELDDITAYLRETCIRCSIRQFRKQSIMYETSDDLNIKRNKSATNNALHRPLDYSNPIFVRSGSFRSKSSNPWMHAIFGRRSVTSTRPISLLIP